MFRDTISVDRLLLDVENPRYPVKVKGQRQAVAAIIDNQKSKQVNLTADVATDGLSPLDNFLVIPKGDKYIVLEGNRRLAAVRLLQDPTLATGTAYADAFKEIAATAHVVPAEVECAVFESRITARPWILKRHNRESGGIGVIHWNPEERYRFNPQAGQQTGLGVEFSDLVAALYPDDPEIGQFLGQLSDRRISVLARLLTSPAFRGLLRLEQQGRKYTTALSAADLRPVVARVLRDITSGAVTTRTLDKAPDRDDYVGRLPQPGASDGAPPSGTTNEGAAEAEDEADDATTQPTTTPRRRRPKRPPLLGTVDARPFGKRAVDLHAELQAIDTSKFPNAAALLLRAVLELAVKHVYSKKKGPVGNTEFKNVVKWCLHHVDPSDKDPTFVGVRKGLQDADSLHAVSTLHAYVHSPNYHVASGDLQSIAANWEPLIVALQPHG